MFQRRPNNIQIFVFHFYREIFWRNNLKLNLKLQIFRIVWDTYLNYVVLFKIENILYTVRVVGKVKWQLRCVYEPLIAITAIERQFGRQYRTTSNIQSRNTRQNTRRNTRSNSGGSSFTDALNSVQSSWQKRKIARSLDNARLDLTRCQISINGHSVNGKFAGRMNDVQSTSNFVDYDLISCRCSVTKNYPTDANFSNIIFLRGNINSAMKLYI